MDRGAWGELIDGVLTPGASKLPGRRGLHGGDAKNDAGVFMRIVFCGCGHADVIPEKVKNTVLHWLGTAQAEIEVVSDLCEMAARRDPRLATWSRDGELRVAACYPRVVEWLFRAGGAPSPDGRLKVFNMRTEGAGPILEGLLAGVETACACRGKVLEVHPLERGFRGSR
jgi:hypothetical protein